jgi:hypothetical protein
MLTKIAYQNTTTLLEPDGTYIGINATQGSISSLDSSIGLLQNVPAYKLDIECDAAVPYSFSAINITTGAWITTLYNHSTLYPGGTIYDSYLTVPLDSITAGPRSAGAVIQFVGFTPDGLMAQLGTLRSYFPSDTFTGVSSPYGDVNFKYFNMSDQSDCTHGGLLYELCLFGIQCKISRQIGTIDYRRETNGYWTIVPVTFHSEKTISPILMSLWQIVLNFQAPIQYINQRFGPVFWESAWAGKSTGEVEGHTDYKVLATNFFVRCIGDRENDFRRTQLHSERAVWPFRS